MNRGEPDPAQSVQDWQAVRHLDIKPDNVFMTESEHEGAYPDMVLSDFGILFYEMEGRIGEEQIPR